MNDEARGEFYRRIEDIGGNDGTKRVGLSIALSKLLPEEVSLLERKLEEHGNPQDYDTVLKLIKQCYGQA